MYLIGHSFPSQVIGAFQVFGLFENIDLRDKFLRGQFVIVNAQGCQEEAGFLFFLGALVVHGGFHLLLNFSNGRSGVGGGGVFPVGFPNVLHNIVNVLMNHMGKIIFFPDLRQLQGTHIQIILAGIVFLYDLLPIRFQNGVHIMDPHIRNPINEDLNIHQKALEVPVQSQLRQQPIVELSAFQKINHFIAQMQIVQVCVWVIFCFCQSQQIVRGHAVEFRQRDDAEGADVFEIIGFIFTQCGFGNAGFLCKLLQSQVPFHSQILQFFLYCQFCIHKKQSSKQFSFIIRSSGSMENL